MKDSDREKGEVICKPPSKGWRSSVSCYHIMLSKYFYILIIDSQLSLWTEMKTGVSENSSVALLMCVAVECFHLFVNYQRSQDASEIVDEIYPLLYTLPCLESINVLFLSRIMISLECHFEVIGIKILYDRKVRNYDCYHLTPYNLLLIDVFSQHA